MGYKTLQFPKGTQFLVTGGAGFIGSNLCEAILNMGYRVRCLDDLSTGKQANVDMFTGKGTVDNSSLERKRMMDLGIAWFKKNPIVGYGMDNYRVLYGGLTGHQTYAHNNFVEIAVDLGIVGLISYYWIFVQIIKDFLKDRYKDKQVVILFSVIIMYLVSHYALVAITELPQNIIIICILAAYALKQKNPANKGSGLRIADNNSRFRYIL